MNILRILTALPVSNDTSNRMTKDWEMDEKDQKQFSVFLIF